MTRSVLHVVVAGEVGGAEQMLCDLAARGGARAHAVALLTSSERLRALFAERGLDVDDGGAAREAPLAYLSRNLGGRAVAWLRDVIRRRDPAIVHLHTFGSHVLGTRAARAEGRAIVRTEHSTRVYDDPSCWPFSRWSLARADRVVCISEHVRRVAEARAPSVARRVRVVRNGVAIDRFTRQPAREARGPLRLVFVGRLEPRKGADVALRAVARVSGVTLVIVGDGAERPRLEALARSLGLEARVTFTGFSADVREHLREADVFVASSRKEGLGVAAIEAMASGRPVVAVPVDALPELVHEGRTGWLAHGTDAIALSHAIARARDGGSQELARRGALARAFVEEELTVSRMREGYASVYAELDDAPRGPR